MLIYNKFKVLYNILPNNF